MLTVYRVENGWAKIDYNGTKAYIKADFIDVSDATPSTTTESASTDTSDQQQTTTQSTEKTVKETVNIRQYADSGSPKIAMASPGDKITVLEDRGNGWAKVNYNGKVGYCVLEYLE